MMNKFLPLLGLLAALLLPAHGYAQNSTISGLNNGGLLQTGDNIPIARSGVNYRAHIGPLGALGGGNGLVTIGTTLNLANPLSYAWGISTNLANLPAPQTGSLIQLGSADTVNTRIELDAFGAKSYFTGVCFGNTAGTPLAVTSGTECGAYNVHAYNGASVVGPLATFHMFAAENQSSGHGGFYAEIATTPIGTTAMAPVVRFENDGGITVPSTVTGGSKAAGTLNISGGYYLLGTKIAQTASSPLVLTAGALTCPTCVTTSGGSITGTPPISVSGAGAVSIANAASDGSTKGAAAFNATDFSCSAGVCDTIQGIATASTPSFAGLTLTANLTLSTHNLVTDTTTGTKIGTATNQKIGFFNATPIVQPSGEIITALQNLGLGASLTIAASDIANAASDGATKGVAAFNATDFTCTTGVCDTIQGIATTSTPSFAALTLTGNLTLSTHNIVSDTVTGTKILTATTQKLGFYNATPIVQPTGDIVTALSNLGLVGTPTLSGADITLGVVPAANGGAGAITGALKANGSGTVTQAACADLSNGATGCNTATGTTGATIALNNGNNTFSGNILFSGNSGTLANGKATVFGVAASGGIFSGQGSTSDVTIQNKSAAAVCNVLTGTTQWNCITYQVNANGILSSPAAATLHLGAADAASPVAQTLGVQNVVGGTSNTAGANFTIAASQGTGTGIGGSIIIQTAPAGTTGTSQNALATAMTINNTGGVTIGAPTGGDKGAGTMNVAGNLYINNVAVAAGISANTATGLSSGFVNKFRNAQMEIAQLGTSGTVTTGADLYTLDGWQVHTVGASVTWSQSGALTLASTSQKVAKSLTVTGLTSNTDTQVYQRIQSYDAAALAGQQVTGQFTYTNNTGATNTPQIVGCYASSADNFGTCTADLAAVNMQACTNGSTCTEAYSFVASANAVNGYQITIDFGAMNSNAKNVVISAADLRVTPAATTGTISTPPYPELAPIGAEYARDEVYFESSYDNGTAPGTATFVGATQWVNYSTTNANFFIRWRTRKRCDPTVTSYSPTTGASGKLDTGGSGDVGANISSQGQTGTLISDSGSIGLAAMSYQYVADCRL